MVVVVMIAVIQSSQTNYLINAKDFVANIVSHRFISAQSTSAHILQHILSLRLKSFPLFSLKFFKTTTTNTTFTFALKWHCGH